MATQNRYYNEAFNAALGSQARSVALEAEFRAIQEAFARLQAEVDTFRLLDLTDLRDFPSTYNGAALKYLRVNVAETAIEFVSGGKVLIKAVGGTSYTLAAEDAGALILTTSSSPATITCPAGGDITEGDVFYIAQWGNGQVTLVGDTGVTLRSSDDLLSTRTRYAGLSLVYTGTDEYFVGGERNAPTLGFAVLDGGNDYIGAQTVRFSTLTDAATIAVDASLSNHFLVTLGGNRTLANPTNLRDGGIYNFWIKQDGSGSKTLGYGSMYKWPGGTAPTLSTAAGALDLVIAQYNATLDILACAITKDIR